jgi:hypothetical protein
MSDNIKVQRKFRTHPMSHEDGGVIVVVERAGKKPLEYPDVKRPDAFIAAIWRNSVEGEVLKVYIKKEEENG